VTSSLADLLFAPEDGGSPRGDQSVVIDDSGATTRTQLLDAAVAIAQALADAGVEKGTPVAVRLRDGWPVVASLFGVWHAGCVYVPVNPRLTETEVERIVGTVQPAAFVEQSSEGALPSVRLVDDAVARHDADIALIQMTSGTTGRPKPVLLRHSGVIELMDAVLHKIRGASRRAATSSTPMPNLIPVSLSLWAGIYNVLFAFRVGAPVVLMNGFDTQRFARLVEEYQIRSTVLPPAAMTMLVDDPSIEHLTPLRFVRSITAPLSPLQARRFHERFGVSVLNSYGQTEIGGEIIGWNAADSREFGVAKLGAVGRPHQGVDVRVDGESGELHVRTPAMSAGYADGSDLADRLTPDGWFRTGDIGRVDNDGFVWIDGRVSDMINRGGLKVFPGEVEEVLRLDDTVADVAVAGVPDDRVGEVPVAFVVLQQGLEFDVTALDALCRTHLAPYKVPVRYERLAALPRNDVGKVLTRELVRGAGAH
jgi:acyl-CoA synthetase (AMP-forming)/AMP-acid ligase II